MANIVGAVNTSHSPFCYMPPELWNVVRSNRALRDDVPFDELETNQSKAGRIRDGFAVLRTKLTEMRPDVLIVFGDDELECFDLNNFPAFAIYVGNEFTGELSTREAAGPRSLQGSPAFKALNISPPSNAKATAMGHPELGISLLTGLMKRGFDPAFCMDMPKADGIGHAIMRPAESLTDMSIPIVPVLLNCYYAPQVSAMRCYALGRAVREVIEEIPESLRIAVVGSGGLWHTPGGEGAHINEEFDRTMLRHLSVGNVRGMAEEFDSYHIPNDDKSQTIRGRNATGMPGSGGPQGGTREVCNWIAASAVCEGRPSTIVDYIPIYASPIGIAFSYCDSSGGTTNSAPQ